jgi:signal transduction histidine kinase
VTFLSGTSITGTTLSEPGDIAALLRALEGRDLSPRGLASLSVLQVRAVHSTYLTLIGGIPDAGPGRPQLFVMQRAYDPETSFLHRMQRDLVLLLLLALLGALATGLMLSEQILRPIRTLVEGAREMQRGNFEAPLQVRSRDEIGYLTERFVEMRERERAYVTSLEEAARLKSEFISVASHELRTPISVIQGYRDLLAEGSLGEMTPRQMQALNAMRDCVTQLTKVADDATHVAQVEGERIVLEPGTCAIEELVDGSIGEALSTAPGRSVEVKREIEPGLGDLWLDPKRMGQALTHLVSNAIRCTADGGEVTVSASSEAHQLVLEVRDTGIGIPSDRLGHIFESSLLLRDSMRHHSSSQLEFRSAGLGLGLAIVRGIVEAHGGTISAQSEVGVGSCFAIRLPRAADGAPRRAA